MMSWHTASYDWIDKLRFHKIITVEAKDLLSVALGQGGFVSGGFARSFAVALLEEKGELPRCDDRLWDDVYSNVTIRYSPKDFKTYKNSDNRLWKSGISDIDMFFPDNESAKKVIDTVIAAGNTMQSWCSPTLGNYGWEFLSGRSVVQIISKISGTPEDVLSGFDLANAKVYLDVNGVHWSDEWLSLERRRLLGIDRADKPNLLWRVKKWFERHKYTNLRPGDHSKWVDVVLDVTEAAAKKQLQMWGSDVRPESIKRFGKYLASTLPPSELLKLSMIYDGYDKMHVLKTLTGLTKDGIV